MKTFTRETLTIELRHIRDRGWIATRRQGNDGGVGNTLEDLLGLSENNLPLPNAGEWELKGQRSDSTSLVTLFHMEPSPRAMKFVPKVLLPKYGWKHREAGNRYPLNERSFRQTIRSGEPSSRGFAVVVNDEKERVEVSFDSEAVDTEEHASWLTDVERQAGLNQLDPQPYWGFDDLFHKAGTKLGKTVYAIADRKKTGGVEWFMYRRFLFLEGFSRERLLDSIARGDMFVDFDARTGHNHGTKFRLKQSALVSMYECSNEV